MKASSSGGGLGSIAHILNSQFPKPSSRSQDKLELDAFRAIDKDGDGELDRDEVFNLSKKLGHDFRYSFF